MMGAARKRVVISTKAERPKLPKKKPADSKKRATKDKVDESEAIAMIADGYTYRHIAGHFGVSPTAFRDWIVAVPERSVRAREAATAAAQSYAEMATEVIEKAADPFELAKAKELAQHYRWAASKANSVKYGDRQQLDVNAKVEVSIEEVDAKIARLLAK